MKEQKFDITGMTCSACSAHIEKNIRKLDGQQETNVNLLTNSMTVKYDENKLNEDKIIQAVIDSGYGATLHNQKEEVKEITNTNDELKSMKKRILISISFLIVLMYVSMQHMFHYPLPSFLMGNENAIPFAFTQFLLTLPILYVNRKYFEVGFKTLFRGAPNMDSLIAIGSSAALLYGIFAIYRIGYGLGHNDMHLVHKYTMNLYFESAAMILTLITVGKYLEKKSKGKTTDAISKLMDLSPKTAVVEKDGMVIEVPVEDVVIGDIFHVKPGANIPVDGVIIEGNTSIDESALTGESMPISKKVNDKVMSATTNKTGFIKCKASKVGKDTTLSQIIQLVEEASSSKAPIAKMADKVSGIFVPVVMGIALLTVVVWLLLGQSFEFAMSCGIAVLVISCPCALGLATPVAIMVGTGKGAENGILIKSAESLEIAHKIQTVVMDKTGTITLGKPSVTDIINKSDFSEEEFLTLVASMEKYSEHPLAEAIVKEAKTRSYSLFDIDEFKVLSGMGIEAKVNGKLVYGGNAKLMKEKNVFDANWEEKADILSLEGKTVLYFADEEKMLGMIAVADIVKPTSKQAIQELEEMGLEVIMLTGDNKKTATAIQRKLGINRIIAEVLPNDKEAVIHNLQKEKKTVAMIGDGINDAPALARADVGIAIGAGSDIAIESADIVLMKSDLLDAVNAIRLSKAVIRNIKENLFWAFFYNTIGIPVAAGVFYYVSGWLLNPMLGAAAMSLSSVCVVSNALRLRRFKVQKRVEELAEKEIKESEIVMKKELKIEGMMCMHCSGRVEKALNALEGVTAQVDLEKKIAYVEGNISDEVLKKAIEDAGYEVSEIK